jgi:hypothetical protein
MDEMSEIWEITNMPGPMAMPVPSGGVRAGEKFEIHLKHGAQTHVAELVVHTAAVMELDSEIKKLDENVRTAGRLTVYPSAIRAYVKESLTRGWDPAQEKMLEMDVASMRGMLLRFKQNGVF